MTPGRLLLVALLLIYPTVAAAQGPSSFPISKEFIAALERTSLPEGTCLPPREVFQRSDIHFVNPMGSASLMNRAIGEFPVLDIYVEASRRPALLFLYAGREMIWQISPQPGSEITAIIVMGRNPSAVVGVPDDTAVINLKFDGFGNRIPACTADDPVEDRLAQGMRQLGFPAYAEMHIREYEGFDRHLRAYSGSQIASINNFGRLTSSALVGDTSVAATSNRKMMGQQLLELISPPGYSPKQEREPPVVMPDGTDPKAFLDQLVMSGDAIVAGPEMIEFTCLHAAVRVLAAGIDSGLHPEDCEVRDIGLRGINWFVLRRSLHFDNISCEVNQRGIRLTVPRGLSVTGEAYGCRIGVWRL